VRDDEIFDANVFVPPTGFFVGRPVYKLVGALYTPYRIMKTVIAGVVADAFYEPVLYRLEDCVEEPILGIIGMGKELIGVATRQKGTSGIAGNIPLYRSGDAAVEIPREAAPVVVVEVANNMGVVALYGKGIDGHAMLFRVLCQVA
jgi:hypothetical protein